MCGIAGFFSWDQEAPVPRGALRAAAARMGARGPDAEGFYERDGVGFAHRRLTVIDLDDGWQPMVDRASGVCLVYNGEIYNFKSLRAELAGLGHAFATNCDTEVLLRAYLQWGGACLDRLVGIYAFAIYDPRCAELVLARDRMGAKPLYFTETAEGVAFASSVAALRCFPGVGTELDSVALLHYFSSIRTTMGGRTMLRDVSTLEPGMALAASREHRATQSFRYWEFPIVPWDHKPVPPWEEAVEASRSMVERAVEEQMVSDVPLGGFLSGGVDSAVIASLAARRGAYGAYNVGYGEHGCNEWPYVRMAAAHAGIECEEIQLGSDGFVDTWRHLAREKGLPLSTPNEVPIFHLASALRGRYTVALSGEGADEVFGGYVVPYFSAYDFDRAARAAPARFGPVERAMSRLYGQPHLTNHLEHHFLLNAWISPGVLRQILLPEALEGFGEMLAYYEGLFQRFEGCSTLDKHMHVHARVNLEGLLNRVDSSTMAASVETRVPYTDHRLAEYLFSMPDAYRIAWRDEAARRQSDTMNVAEIDQRGLLESKRLLRGAFGRDVPRGILERRKVSFPVPFREWLGGALRSFAADMLSSSPLLERVARPEALNELIEGADNPALAMRLWPLVNLALWGENLLEVDSAEPDVSCGIGPAFNMVS